MIRTPERVASVVIGSTLVAVGVRNHRVSARSAALAGAGALLYRGISGNAVLVPALTGNRDDAPAVLRRALTIDAPPERLAALFRDPQTLDQIVGPRVTVRAVDAQRLQWSARTPAGEGPSWETRFVDDLPDEVHWTTAESSPIRTEGWLRFAPAPADWGTQVTLEVQFDAGASPIAKAAANMHKLFAQDALRRLKMLAETGEIANLRNNPAARDGGTSGS